MLLWTTKMSLHIVTASNPGPGEPVALLSLTSTLVVRLAGQGG